MADLLKWQELCKKVGESGRRWDFFLILPFEKTALSGVGLCDKILAVSTLILYDKIRWRLLLGIIHVKRTANAGLWCLCLSGK